MTCGIDLVCVSAFEKLLSESFLRDHFSAAEVAYCESAAGAMAPRLAARYAAKEAFIKAIEGAHLFRPRLVARVVYHEIEVAHDPHGRPYLLLQGAMLKLVEELKITTCLSLSHDGDYAVAQVVLK